MRSYSLGLRLTTPCCCAAAVILMTTLSCDSIGPEPKPVPPPSVPEAPASPQAPTPPAAPQAPTPPIEPDAGLPMVPIIPGQIVFIDPWEKAIFVADSTGRRLQRVSQTSGATNVAVSTDGRKIAFSVPCDANYSLCSHLYVLTADGTDRLLLQTGDSLYGPVRPTWSPDGQRIAFVQGAIGPRGFDSRHIYAINADGTDVTQLTHSAYNEWPAWSPDGKKIVFARFDDHDLAAVDQAIFEMDTDGSNARRLRTGFRDRWPTWSPDGSLIAFLGFNEGNYVMNLFVMNADGSNVRILKSSLSYDERPTWSPDGKSITFIVSSAARMCEDIWDYGVVPCGQSAKRIGLNGLIDYAWELASASNLVWQR